MPLVTDEADTRPPRRFEETDPLCPYVAAYQIDRVLEQYSTRYQELFLFESAGFGRILALDGVVQVTELDTYVYHELMAHPILCAHPDPRRVAIVGGGDGHLLHEVLKHESVQEVYVLELDGAVIDVCRAHFPEIAAAFDDPRTRVRTGDAVGSMAELSELDAIICDSTDPVGQAARLFESPFYARCAGALSESGMFVAQTESLHFHASTVRDCRAALAEHFAKVATMNGTLVTYPGAWWTFTMASKGPQPRTARRDPAIETRLYAPDIHEWFFLPESLVQRLLG